MKLDLPDLSGLLDFLVLPDYQVVMDVTVNLSMVNQAVTVNQACQAEMELLAKKAKGEILVLVVMLVFPDCKDRKESKALMVAKE